MIPFDSIAFYLLGLMAVGAAYWTIAARSVVHSIVAFAGVLFAVAGLFGLLEASFLLIGQLVIFVGGMVSLLLFGVMFNKESDEGVSDSSEGGMTRGGFVRIVIGISFLGGIVFSVLASFSGAQGIFAADLAEFSRTLFGMYWEAVLLGFFALFIAIVTAVFLLEED